MNRNFSAGAAITLVLGLILVFATSGNTISLGSFAISLVTVGWILTVVGAVLLVISLIPRRTTSQTLTSVSSEAAMSTGVMPPT